MDHIRHEFFLNVLELPVRPMTSGYNEEIELATKKKEFRELYLWIWLFENAQILVLKFYLF